MSYSERSNHARFICSNLQPTPSTRILHTGQRVKDELIPNFGEYVSLGQFHFEALHPFGTSLIAQLVKPYIGFTPVFP